MEKTITKTKAELRKEKIMALLQEADQQNQPAVQAGIGSSFEELYKEGIKHTDFHVGDVVKGKVVSVSDDHVLVDINYKSEGLIPKSEFRTMESKGGIQEGQEVEVYIDRIENDDGMMVLSKDRADIIRVWKDIARVAENEEVIEGTVMAKVKGGLSVDIGVKAFLPGSQIDLRPAWDLSSYVGKTYKFKVIKFNQKRGNIVLSRRVLLSQERKDLRSRTLSEIKEGAIVRGVVKNITDYGAFLDLGGLDGLLHITDMSWNRIKRPAEVLSLGEEIEVKVLRFDQEKNRVSLGLKQMTEDPWNVISQDIKTGDIIKAQVVSLTDYGAFMKIKDGVEGLVHISEMSYGKKVKHPSQVLNVDEETVVKVLGMDQKHHRISLGIKQLQENPWLILKEKYSLGDKLEVTVKSLTDFGMFVQIQGEEMDGFIHGGDLSWTEHIIPRAKYKKGDVLTAVVRDISSKEERFSLSVKHLQADPWVNVSSKYPPGSRHKVQVKKLMDFGVFVQLEPGVEGLIHISELSVEKLAKPDQVTKIGELLTAEVLSIDMPARKIGLSIKQVQIREKPSLIETAKSDPAKSDTTTSSSAPAGQESEEVKLPKKTKIESFFGRALKASLGGGSAPVEKPTVEKPTSTVATEEKEQEQGESSPKA